MCTPLAGFKKATALIVLAAGFLVLHPSVLLAQTPPGFPDLPPEAPIDGGLGLLALAGGAFAARKFQKRFAIKDRNQSEE